MALGTAREHCRRLCQGPAQRGARAKAEAGLGRGRGSSGSSQPSALEQKLKLCWAPSSPELSPGTAAGHCWDQSCTEPGPAPRPGLQLLLSSKDTFKHDLHQQRGRSISVCLSSGLYLHFKLLSISALENQFYTVSLKALLIII